MDILHAENVFEDSFGRVTLGNVCNGQGSTMGPMLIIACNNNAFENTTPHFFSKAYHFDAACLHAANPTGDSL
jgi:hypothetical protein